MNSICRGSFLCNLRRDCFFAICTRIISLQSHHPCLFCFLFIKARDYYWRFQGKLYACTTAMKEIMASCQQISRNLISDLSHFIEPNRLDSFEYWILETHTGKDMLRGPSQWRLAKFQRGQCAPTPGAVDAHAMLHQPKLRRKSVEGV